MAIRVLDRREENEVKKQIRKYNAKITRLSKEKKYQGVVLPEKLNVNQTLIDLSNRRELRRLLNQVNKFMQRDATKIVTNRQGVRAVSFVIDQAKRDQAVANRRNEKIYNELAAIPVTAAGRNIKRTVGQFYPEQLSTLRRRSFNFNNYRAAGELKQRVSNLSLQSKEVGRRITDLRFKENYITALRNELGVYAEMIIDLISTVDASDLLKLVLSDVDLQIRYIYDKRKQEQKFNEIMSHLIKGLGES